MKRKIFAKICVAILTIAIICFFFKQMAYTEEGNITEVMHYMISMIIAILSRRYIVRKEAMKTMKELAHLAYERSPKTRLRGQFLRYPKEAERYLTVEERDRFRLCMERLGMMW